MCNFLYICSMVSLDEFRENARAHGVCEEYGGRWSGCVTKKELFDLACEVQGMLFLVKAVSEGWGISPEVIVKEFPRMINGGYIARVETKRGKHYGSQIICRYDEPSFVCDTTVCAVIDSHTTITIAKNIGCLLFVDKASEIEIICPDSGRVKVETYSDKVTTNNKDRVKIKMLKA